MLHIARAHITRPNPTARTGRVAGAGEPEFLAGHFESYTTAKIRPQSDVLRSGDGWWRVLGESELERVYGELQCFLRVV